MLEIGCLKEKDLENYHLVMISESSQSSCVLKDKAIHRDSVTRIEVLPLKFGKLLGSHDKHNWEVIFQGMWQSSFKMAITRTENGDVCSHKLSYYT